MIQLLQGDCYELIKQIPDKSIDLIYTDIPYQITISETGSKDALSRRKRKLDSDLSDIKDGIDFSILDQFRRIQKKTYLYIWCSVDQMYPIMQYFKKWNVPMWVLVWCKTNPIPTIKYRWLSDLEYCLLFKEKGTPPYNDGYEIKSKWYVSPINKEDKDNWTHPTIKPLELVERHIKHSTREGDTVLDCFMGSGTTGIACRNLNRNFIGMEINEEYFKIAERRMKEQPQELKLFEL